jgi:hypothetical protein
LLASLPWKCKFCADHETTTWSDTLYHVAIQHEKLYQALENRKDPRFNAVLQFLFPEKYRRRHERSGASRPATSVKTAATHMRTESAVDPPAVTISNSPDSEPCVAPWLVAGSAEPQIYLDVCGEEEEEDVEDFASESGEGHREGASHSTYQEIHHHPSTNS